MTSIFQDRRFIKILTANVFSSIGSGITMFAIPWVFVSKEGGANAFGYVTLITTIALFLAAPLIGNLIDYHSRKKLLLWGQLIGFTMVGFFASIGFLGMEYQTWHLVLLFLTGSFYFSLFYPTMFAMNQEIFDRSLYKSLNGMMEIQGQLSTFIVAGGIASILLETVDLHWILLIDAVTYTIAFLILSTIPYIHSKQTSSKRKSFWGKMHEGYVYLKDQPLLFFFLLSAFIPFITVMVTNYVFPIYIEATLQASGSIYGLQGMLFGFGSLLAGIFIPVFIKKFGNVQIILIGILTFTISMIFISIFPFTLLFLILSILRGFGNASTRVARNTLMMETIPNEKMGRVNSLFETIGLMLRITLIGSFTVVIPTVGTILPVSILSLILVMAVIVAWVSRRYFSNASKAKVKANISDISLQ
ncbi:MFS transporter [Chengkuizengella axinellae]|uniref:MFS transporter n=1 Tax=Chengkuizengella axinellae TaxID=3064388 RepID=A0ABT9IZG8_9BACL|nr:MFS transporter [Chengkuizengella sp. 2205SS18-9]MDP5274766.1 MFS transporter [Chengkuizengella sp. 2205SS18-9]